MSYLIRAKELFEEAKNIRRKLHQNAEVGFELPKTLALVAEQLDAFGIAYEKNRWSRCLKRIAIKNQE